MHLNFLKFYNTSVRKFVVPFNLNICSFFHYHNYEKNFFFFVNITSLWDNLFTQNYVVFGVTSILLFSYFDKKKKKAGEKITFSLVALSSKHWNGNCYVKEIWSFCLHPPNSIPILSEPYHFFCTFDI